MKTQSPRILSILVLSACVLAASLSIATDTGAYPALATDPTLGVYFDVLENQLLTPTAKIIPEGGADNHFGYSVFASEDTVMEAVGCIDLCVRNLQKNQCWTLLPQVPEKF